MGVFSDLYFRKREEEGGAEEWFENVHGLLTTEEETFHPHSRLTKEGELRKETF